jgi:hypothetical protein
VWCDALPGFGIDSTPPTSLMNQPVTLSARNHRDTDPWVDGAAAHGSNADDGAPSAHRSSLRAPELIVFGTGGRESLGPGPDWKRIAAMAVAISLNGFALLHVSLPPSERGPAFVPPEPVHDGRHALTVEPVEPVVIDMTEVRDPLVPERAVSARASRQSPPVSARALSVPEHEPSVVAAPRFRFGLSELRPIDEVTPAFGPLHDPKAAVEALYRRPAITYEPTRFNDAWVPVSLAERARQSTFSYARSCSLNDEMRQVRGCSRDERNADAAARAGDRVDTTIRPDAAVD